MKIITENSCATHLGPILLAMYMLYFALYVTKFGYLIHVSIIFQRCTLIGCLAILRYDKCPILGESFFFAFIFIIIYFFIVYYF